MAENSEKPSNPRGDSGAPPLLDQPPADWVLQALVDLANKTGIETGIALSVGGLVVSGKLISGKRFFEELASEALQASGDQNVIRPFSEYLGRFGKVYDQSQQDESSSDEEEARGRLPGFIHLRDARFFHNAGQPMPSNRGVRWRGRLSAIDGFSLGSMFAS